MSKSNLSKRLGRSILAATLSGVGLTALGVYYISRERGFMSEMNLKSEIDVRTEREILR